MAYFLHIFIIIYIIIAISLNLIAGYSSILYERFSFLSMLFSLVIRQFASTAFPHLNENKLESVAIIEWHPPEDKDDREAHGFDYSMANLIISRHGNSHFCTT
ncbi:MAG: hypothetical protein ACRENG_32575 [bacterium]